jgi:Protein of unknown function (DUF1616)
MSTRDKALLATVLAAALAIIGTVVGAGPVLRTLLGLPLVFYLPGRAILAAAFRGQLRGLSAAVFAVGLSLAVTIFCGFALHFVGALTPEGWIIALSLATFAACGASYLTGRDTPRPVDASNGPPALRPLEAAAIGCAALLCVGALSLASRLAISHPEFAYTQMWMVPYAGSPGTFTLGVKNAERGASLYDLEVMLDGRVVLVQRSISLQPGEIWTSDLSLPMGRGGPHTAEARLFRDGNDRLVYRRVWLRTGA